MQGIRYIKNELGLSNTQLAIFLGVSNSVLCMVLKGQRSLPTKANTILAQLLLIMQNIPITSTSSSNDKKQLNTNLLQQIRLTEMKLLQANKMLAEMQKEHRQSHKLQQFALLLEQNPIHTNNLTKENLWLQAIVSKAQQKQKMTGADKQKLLQMQIEILLYEKERLIAFKQSLI